MQGLIGKYSLSPLVYEDGLKELEDLKDMIDKLTKALVQSGKSEESTQRSKRFANFSETFTCPSSNNKIAMLENEVKKLKEDIDRLKFTSISNEDKIRLSSLEASIDHGAEVNVVVNTSILLTVASKTDNSEVIKLLLDNGANINDDHGYGGMAPL